MMSSHKRTTPLTDYATFGSIFLYGTLELEFFMQKTSHLSFVHLELVWAIVVFMSFACRNWPSASPADRSLFSLNCQIRKTFQGLSTRSSIIFWHWVHLTWIYYSYLPITLMSINHFSALGLRDIDDSPVLDTQRIRYSRVRFLPTSWRESTNTSCADHGDLDAAHLNVPQFFPQMLQNWSSVRFPNHSLQEIEDWGGDVVTTYSLTRRLEDPDHIQYEGPVLPKKKQDSIYRVVANYHSVLFESPGPGQTQSQITSDKTPLFGIERKLGSEKSTVFWSEHPDLQNQDLVIPWFSSERMKKDDKKYTSELNFFGLQRKMLAEREQIFVPDSYDGIIFNDETKFGDIQKNFRVVIPQKTKVQKTTKPSFAGGFSGKIKKSLSFFPKHHRHFWMKSSPLELLPNLPPEEWQHNRENLVDYDSNWCRYHDQQRSQQEKAFGRVAEDSFRMSPLYFQ